MKKLILLSFVAIIGVIGLSSNTSIDTINSGDDFSFPEYSDVLYTKVAGDGCYAECGTTSCSGSGDCVCSCSTLQCDCEPNPDPDPIGYNEVPEIDVSISEKQYKNLKALAYMLYEAEDNNANKAYLHLGNAIEGLKSKDAPAYHKERDLYYKSLYEISSENTKLKLNTFFEKVGVTERV
ncbi:hypothetical protein [uncultured Marixanthomonas sp.]|uniref:hypothetical protein n=1 Tax=uncultured Marixanthomonas sp. TaxID=757245 RepID=UPI0030DC4848|tara:strand:- start:5254 stop:5793 length:540 start_codon:yes stop_codon:yes gene_type:complete